jgi:hypothetical protein
MAYTITRLGLAGERRAIAKKWRLIYSVIEATINHYTISDIQTF